jgi:hypothetical protein
MGFDEAQQMLTKHITYLLNQCTRKILWRNFYFYLFSHFLHFQEI